MLARSEIKVVSLDVATCVRFFNSLLSYIERVTRTSWPSREGMMTKLSSDKEYASSSPDADAKPCRVIVVTFSDCARTVSEKFSRKSVVFMSKSKDTSWGRVVSMV